MYLDQLDADQVSAALDADPIMTANSDLENVLRPIVDSAPDRGIEDLKVIIVDRDPLEPTALRDFANEIVADTGGTVIVRAPFSVASSSDSHPRAALEIAQYEMMDDPSDYPEGFNLFIDEVTDYTVPFFDYALIAGGAIAIVFACLAAYWWVRSHGRRAN